MERVGNFYCRGFDMGLHPRAEHPAHSIPITHSIRDLD